MLSPLNINAFRAVFRAFRAEKDRHFSAVLQCSDGQSFAEWARIAYLRTDFLEWISFVNKLMICAMEWKDPLSSPCKGEARYLFFFSEKWRAKSEKSRWRNWKISSRRTYIASPLQGDKRGSLFFYSGLAQIVENDWYLTVGKGVSTAFVASFG